MVSQCIPAGLLEVDLPSPKTVWIRLCGYRTSMHLIALIQMRQTVLGPLRSSFDAIIRGALSGSTALGTEH